MVVLAIEEAGAGGPGMARQSYVSWGTSSPASLIHRVTSWLSHQKTRWVRFKLWNGGNTLVSIC